MVNRKRDVATTDVVIVGSGLAGATAAIVAHDAGVEAMLLEKSQHFGGNSILAGGGVLCANDPEGAFQYLQALCGGRTDPEVVRAQVNMMAETEGYLTGLCKVSGAKQIRTDRPGMFPFPGRQALYSLRVEEVPGFQGYPWILPSEAGFGAGATLMKVIEDNLNLRKIPIALSTAARELLTDGNGAVSGVRARREGKDVVFQARKAVILACGGFEHNEALKLQFLEAKPSYAMSPLTHTGDGVVMAAKLGAALWHMWHVHGSYGFKYAEFPIAFRHQLGGVRDPYPGRPYYFKMRWIVVDRKGKRFMNEYPPAPQDTPHRALGHFDPDLPGYPRIPCYLIFDEVARKERHMAHPLGLREIGYEWSNDNSKETERGWILRAQGLEDLARKIHVPSDNLTATVKKWNHCVSSRNDGDFGRPADTMFAPIEVPPYYAMEAWPVISNTQGGPRHNARQQVVDAGGNPISRLYAIGELGSMFGDMYEPAGNLGECIAGSRIAARCACEEKRIL